MSKELSETEKVTLLGVADTKAIAKGDYDKNFYNAIKEAPLIKPSELKDGIRRALLAYADNMLPPGMYPAYALGFTEGYQVARKLNMDIIAKKPKKSEEPANPNRLL